MKKAGGKSNRVTEPRPKPNSAWRCGHARFGRACALGPTAQGTCRHSQLPTGGTSCSAADGVSSDCPSSCSQSANCQAAVHRAGEEFKGREGCGDESCRGVGDGDLVGLGPCVPERNSWFLRQNVAINTAILVGGILLLCMALPQREAVFVPGGLSKKHSQILGNELISQRCSLCHPNSHTDVGGIPLSQDDLCMKCHEAHMPDAAFGSAHDLQVSQLAKLVSHVGEVPTTQCAQCHVEHHGAERDLKSITDARCQACHQRQFASFADGHPRFDDYPYRSERRVAFDHRAHQDQHFAKKNESFDCARCHVNENESGQVGSVFRSVGFEAACASCHSDAIRASTISGWALLQVPSVMSEDVEDPAFGIRDWPEEAQFGYEGSVGLPMRMLLAGEEGIENMLADFPGSGELGDVPAIHRQAYARTLARAFRSLVADVAANGQAAWRKRLIRTGENALGRSLNEMELALVREMIAGLPPDLFREIERRWFRNQRAVVSEQPVNQFRFVSGTSRSQEEQGGDLLDDDLLDGGLPEEGLSDEDLLGTEEALSSKTFRGDPPSKPRMTALRGGEHVTQGGWYLDHSVLAVRYMPRGHGDKTLAAWFEFASLMERSRNQVQPGHFEWLSPGENMPGGCGECHLVGNEQEPASAWSNWESVVRPENVRLFTKFDHTPHLTLPTVNDCRYCHRIETDRPGKLEEIRNSETVSGSLVSDWLNTEAATCEFLHGEFKPMDRSQCVACHRQGGASDGCTQCHNYHVGSKGFGWSHSK